MSLILVDGLKDRPGTGGPKFPNGLHLPAGIGITGDGHINMAGVCTFSGNVTIGGTLTYEDVTNIDSVGVVTARAGVNVSGGQLIVGSGLTIGNAGVATFSGTSDIHLKDNVKLNVGDSLDLNIYHDGSNSYIQDSGSGALIVTAADQCVFQKGDGSNRVLNLHTTNGTAALMHQGNQKLITSSTGVSVTGDTTADGLIVGSGITFGSAGVSTFSGTADVHLVDNVQLLIGNSRDLRIHNNGTDNRLDTYGVNLDLINKNADGNVYEKMLRCVPNGAVEAYYDASKKWETTKFGTVTTGISTADGISCVDATKGIEARSTSTQNTDTNKALKVKNNSDTNTFSVSYKGEVFVGPYDGGFLGIGTDNPQTQLHITAAGPVITHDATNGSSGLRINSKQYQTSGQLFRVQNAGITTFVIQRNGYVGINTHTVQRGPLHVHSNGTGDCQIHLTNDETGPTGNDGFTIFTGGDAGPDAGFVNRESGGAIEMYTHNGSSIGERFRIHSAGQIGIGGANYGTSGQVLTSGGSGAAPSWADAGGGAWEVVSTTVLSGSTSDLQLYGWSNSYAQYKVVFNDCYHVDSTVMRIRFYLDGTSGNNGTLNTSSNNYKMTSKRDEYGTNMSSTYGGSAQFGSGNSYMFIADVNGNPTAQTIWSGELIFPMKTTSYNSANRCYGTIMGGNYLYDSISCRLNDGEGDFLTGIHIYWVDDSGSPGARSPSTGRVTLLRMKYS